MQKINYDKTLPDENEFIEYKTTGNKLPKDIWETVSSFENTAGGLIVLGIKEERKSGHVAYKISGVKHPHEILEQFWSNLDKIISYNNLSNSDVKIVSLDKNIDVIEIHISEAIDNKKPVTANGIPYIRKGSIDKKAVGEDYRILESNASDDLDTKVLKNYWIDDLDSDTIQEYKLLLTSRAEYEHYADYNEKQFLKAIGVISKDYNNDGKEGITLGGLLFFGKNNAIIHAIPHFQLDYYDQTSITDRWTTRISSVMQNLNIFSFYRAAFAAIKRTISNKFQLDENMIRVDTSGPMEIALREALLNMLMHANYLIDEPIEAHAHINYYTFTNPGKMKVPVDSFFTTNQTKYRNPVISKLFVQIGLGERAGHGGQKIYETAIENNLRYPEIKSNERETRLRIWNVDYAQSFSGKEIDERERAILKAMLSTPLHSLTHKEIESKCNLSRTKTTDALKALMDKQIVEKIGNGRSTRYGIRTTLSQLIAQAEAMPSLMRKILNNKLK